MKNEIGDDDVDDVLRCLFRKLDARRRTGRIRPQSYMRLRNAVDRLASSFHLEYSARHAIFTLIRQKFGCRATELRESDLDGALELLADLEKHVQMYVNVRHDFESRAIKQVFGAAGVVALEAGAEETLAKLDAPFEVPAPMPPTYGGNVVRFPLNA